MYLLDTNACLDFLLARNAAIVPRIERAFGKLSISAITTAELRVGNRASADPVKDARNVDTFLTVVSVAPFDSVAADIYGQVARTIGVQRSSFDRLIAAHALALDLTLVTNNERHFADVPGLRVENWTR